MTTQPEIEAEDWKEEFWYKVAEWNTAQPEDIDIYANQLEMLIEYHIRERVHQELQKAQEHAVIWTMRNFETMHKEDWGTKTFGEYMLDRYQSELDKPKLDDWNEDMERNYALHELDQPTDTQHALRGITG